MSLQSAGGTHSPAGSAREWLWQRFLPPLQPGARPWGLTLGSWHGRRDGRRGQTDSVFKLPSPALLSRSLPEGCSSRRPGRAAAFSQRCQSPATPRPFPHISKACRQRRNLRRVGEEFKGLPGRGCRERCGWKLIMDFATGEKSF